MFPFHLAVLLPTTFVPELAQCQSKSGLSLQDMTYAKQLEAYEERVMQKRLEEMPETERQRLMEEVKQEGTRKKGGSN